MGGAGLGFFRRGLLKAAHSVMCIRIGAGLKLVHVMLIITGACLVATTTEMLQPRQPITEMLTPNQKMQIYGLKWRQERNFWISTLSFLMWWLLNCFYQVAYQKLVLEDENVKLKTDLSDSNKRLNDLRGSIEKPQPSAPVAETVHEPEETQEPEEPKKDK
ncbi:unnamed protein product [Ostreobium quekettii]|uniref:BAP29/BAP31 transmembrane domain-containing protein n=1 Tax=Ostreobium quekettii TaxID=121088 RepID=A0A8S1J5W6_9CHLO|nr:unnamed protein product [Ostreobium quekettii]|eukprot:evm.model.scf_85EXC.2 EVM.evm.TU.scf_85EXC.2   scf_85EXC:21994-24925(-)